MSSTSGCCWSQATAGWPVRSTPTSFAPGSPPAASTQAHGPHGGVLRFRPPAGVIADLPRPGAGGELHRLHRPARLRRRPADRRPADGGLYRRRGRPGRGVLQRLHLADLAGGPAGGPAAAPAGHGARGGLGAGGARAAPRSAPAGRWSSTSPTPRRSSSGWFPTTSRSRSTARCSSRPPPSTARG